MHPTTANTLLYILIHAGWLAGLIIMVLALSNLNPAQFANKETSLMPGVVYLTLLKSDYHRFILSFAVTGMFWLGVWFLGMESWLKGIYIKAGGKQWI